MSAVLKEPEHIFRPMRPEDVAVVVAIEGEVYCYGWNTRIFHDCLDYRYSCWVMEEVGQIVGYGVFSVVASEAHILNIAIHQGYQGDGRGRRLLLHILTLAAEHGADTVLLEVRPSNLAAIHLYESEGFCQVGSRHNYYPARKGREDALIMAKALIYP